MQNTLQKIRRLLPRRASSIILGDFYNHEYTQALPLLHIHGHQCTAVQIIAPQDKTLI